MTYENYIFYPLSKTNGHYVFKNKLDIFDSLKLKQKEKDVTFCKIKNQKAYPKGSFDKSLLLKYNKYLFGDLYPFAGETKKWDLSKAQEILGGYSVHYCPANYVDSSLDDVFRLLNKIEKNENIEKLSKQIADAWAYLWQIHPFYEGNTRTTGLFMIELLKSKGIDFNVDCMNKGYHVFRNALVLYSVQKEDELNSLVLEGISCNQKELIL